MIARVARNTAWSCLALAIAFGLWRQSIVSAIAVVGGGLLIGISFWAIRGAVDDLVLRFRSETGQKSAAFLLVKFFTRHAIVALAAYGMMVRLQLDPVAMLVGVTSLGVAVAVEAVRSLRWRRFP